jgi:hypothetical protein
MPKSCPPNNITVERLMAKLDSQLKAAPSANVLTIGSSVMLRNNQTSSWLDEKDDIKQNSIVTSARKQNAYMINQRKERKQQLLKDHQKIIQERESANKLTLEKREKENDKMRENMATIGIWDEIDIECKIDEIKCKSGKIQAIKKQINMIKESLKIDNSDKHLVTFSSKGKQHSVEKIVENLRKLHLMRNSEQDIVADDNLCLTQMQIKPSSLVGKGIKHTWEINNKDEIWNGQLMTYKSGVFRVIIK